MGRKKLFEREQNYSVKNCQKLNLHDYVFIIPNNVYAISIIVTFLVLGTINMIMYMSIILFLYHG